MTKLERVLATLNHQPADRDQSPDSAGKHPGDGRSGVGGEARVRLGLETFSYMPWVVGVPLGRGSIDLAACYRLLAGQTALTRLCIEVCYGYRAPFRRPEAQGEGGRLGAGAFRVVPPPHDPACIAPYPNYQNPAALPPAKGEEFPRWCDRAVVESVAYVRELGRFGHPRPAADAIRCAGRVSGRCTTCRGEWGNPTRLPLVVSSGDVTSNASRVTQQENQG
jgi:hypothetical protein